MTQFLQSKFSTYGKTCFGCTQRDEWLHRQQEEIDSLKEELNYLQRESVEYKREIDDLRIINDEQYETLEELIQDYNIDIYTKKGDLIDIRV